MALNVTPNATDRISDTQPLILQNFNTINTAFNVNHVDYNTADQGKHKFINFTQQVQATAQAAITYPELGLYSAPYAVTGINELFFRNSGNVVPDVPITAADYSGSGWTYLASGIILQWGTFAVNDTSNNTPSAPFARAFPNACLRVMVSASNANGAITAVPTIFVVSFNATGFVCSTRNGNSTNTSACNYIAIGY